MRRGIVVASLALIVACAPGSWAQQAPPEAQPFRSERLDPPLNEIIAPDTELESLGLGV